MGDFWGNLLFFGFAMAGENECALEESEVREVRDEPKSGAEPAREYTTGWRLHVLTFGYEFLLFLDTACAGAGYLTIRRVTLSLFLSTLETTIVSTSLISITNALNGFGRGSWVVTSYLLTYTGKSFFFFGVTA